MATQSTSNTAQVIQGGGSFGIAGINTRFKDTDYGPKALGDPQQLRKFLAQLNPIVQQLQSNTDTGVNIGNLDGDIVTYALGAFQSYWNAVTSAATGVVTAGTGPVCSDGSEGWVAVSKDGWGQVSLHVSVTTSGAGTVGTLPTEMAPGIMLVQPTAGGQDVTINTDGTVTVAAGATFGPTVITYPSATGSPGSLPPFPVYLKVAQGRTPVAVFLAGVKPTTQGQDIYKIDTGLLGAPLGVSWTWLSGTAPDPATSQKVNTIRIDNVPGLIPNMNYQLTFITLYALTGQSSGG